MNIFTALFNPAKKINAKLEADASKIIEDIEQAFKGLEKEAGQAMVADANNPASTLSKEQALDKLLQTAITSVAMSATGGVPVVVPDPITNNLSKMIIEKLANPAEKAIGKKLSK